MPAEPLIGEIYAFPYNFAPRGYAQCDGQLVPINQNEALFSIIGTSYGGDGMTTFALPDLRGRAPIHMGQGAGLTNYEIAERDGTSTVSLTESTIASHTHQPMGLHGPTSGTTNDPSAQRWAYSSNLPYDSSANGTMAADAAGTTGRGLPHENMSPFLGLNFCIALEGIFPGRS